MRYIKIKMLRDNLQFTEVMNKIIVLSNAGEVHSPETCKDGI